MIPGGKWFAGVALALTALGMAGCAADEEPAAAGEEDDLTSLTARQRILTFDGIVYVAPGSTNEQILGVAREQTQTAFGALLASEVAVRSREVAKATDALRVVDGEIDNKYDPSRTRVKILKP